MMPLLEKYTRKLELAGLCESGSPLFGGLDVDYIWNRQDADCAELKKVFQGLNINSLLFARPAEPYNSIISCLAKEADGAIHPSDCETRTFLHDLPVVPSFEAGAVIDKLKQRKSVIIPDRGIVTWGTVSPEQAYIFYSSVCFACYVKFFTDYLKKKENGGVPKDWQRVFDLAAALEAQAQYRSQPPGLIRELNSEDKVYEAIHQAGRLTVESRLVDSFFGNISYTYNNILYVSQTGSSLDELEGCVDACPLDGSSCNSITASSEFIAHREVVGRTGRNAILHGHPKFSVIMSMHCRRDNCECLGRCHLKCPEMRMVGDIPIVPGEVGTGPTGLCNTMPAALEGGRGVIVYGHGLFTASENDFTGAFTDLTDIENMCRDQYFKLAI